MVSFDVATEAAQSPRNRPTSAWTSSTPWPMRIKSDRMIPNAAGVTWISSVGRNGELMVKRVGDAIFTSVLRSKTLIRGGRIGYRAAPLPCIFDSKNDCQLHALLTGSERYLETFRIVNRKSRSSQLILHSPCARGSSSKGRADR